MGYKHHKYDLDSPENNFGFERGSYYQVENKDGQTTFKFLVLGDQRAEVVFAPSDELALAMQAALGYDPVEPYYTGELEGFELPITKVYSSHAWDGRPHSANFDIYPHFYLEKDGEGYWDPVLDPKGGFHIIPSSNFYFIDGSECRQCSEEDTRSYYGFHVFIEGLSEKPMYKTTLHQTITKVSK
jgi:hypothetical protein